MMTRRFLLALCALALSIPAFGQQDLVGLYLTWHSDPTTTMTVNWVDLRETSSLDLHYRRTGTTAWQKATGSRFAIADTTLAGRRVNLTGLEPDTNYDFAIGAEPARPADIRRFRTLPRDLNRPVRFVTGGDMMHNRTRVDLMNAVAGKRDPDFALLGGDLAYANGVSSSRWVDWLKSWMEHAVADDGRVIPMVVGIGNHEVRGGRNGKVPDDAPYFYSLFQLPESRAYYALDFGRYLSLIVLDTQHTNPVEGAQAEWLDKALAARRDQQFVFVCYHYPAYGTTKAPRGGTPLDAPLSVAIRQHWMPHWEKYGVTAVFENDHHNFKRSHRLRQHKRDDANGILYLGDGAWAVQTREVPADAWWLAKAEGRNHIFDVKISATGAAHIQAVDIEGAVFDDIRIPTARTKPAE
jgi:acid phosphatase type 7